MKVKVADILITERARTELGDDFEELKESIRLRGQFNPILINEKNELIAGFRRYSCFLALKLEEIEAVVYENLSPTELKIIELEENIHKNLEWNERASLVKDIHRLQQEIHGTSVSGHSSEGWGVIDTAKLLGLSPSSVSQDLGLADAIEDLPAISNIQSRRQALKFMGQAKELTLLKALALREDKENDEDMPYVVANEDAIQFIKEKIADEIVDLTIFDPPWGVDIDVIATSRGPKGTKTSYNDDSLETSRDLAFNLLPEIYRTMREDGHMYMFIGVQYRDYYYHLLTNYENFLVDSLVTTKMFPPGTEVHEKIKAKIQDLQAKREWKFHVEEVPLIWVKEGGGYTDFEYKFMPRYETFLFCSKGIKKSLSEACSNVFEYSRPATTERIHTQEKSLKLIERLIKISTKPGDLVLDPCAGSFVTSVAAIKTKRKSIAIDSNKDAYLRGLERLKNTSEGDEDE